MSHNHINISTYSNEHRKPHSDMLWATTLVCLVLVSLYVKADYGCSEDLTQTDKTRKIFLDFHNDVRRNISTGIQPNRPVYSRFLGPAKNMYKLKWDCDLEKKAQYQVSSCTFKVPPGMCRLSMSQNSISVNYVNGKEEEALRFAQKNWMNPVTTYGVPPNRKFFYRLETFANIANHKNMKLGCAYKVCGSEMLVACIYGTKRIPPMQELWENGRTCECDAHPDSFCSNGICETNMVMKPETKTSTKKPRPPVEGPDSCKANTGMTDDLREIFLKKHNYYRSFVAKGLAKDKFGGYAPKAARMLKMVYDCEIEANALRHAEKCRWGHSIKADRFGLGENVWASLQPEMNRSLAAEMACDKFFAELKDHGVGQDNILTNELFYRQKEQIGHYTQMVWQSSYKLGCVIEYCNDPPVPMTFVVCQYRPGGNFIDQLIYEKGEPCQTDDDCKCTNCKCSRDEALCIMP